MNRRLAPRRLLVAGVLSAAIAQGCVPQPVGREPGPSRPTPVATVTPPPATPAGPTPIPTFTRPTPTPRPTFFAYRVRTGDTLITIARRFETTPDSIAYWNRATYPTLDPDSRRYNPNDIRVGWTLLLVPNKEVDPEDLPPAAGSPDAPGTEPAPEEPEE